MSDVYNYSILGFFLHYICMCFIYLYGKSIYDTQYERRIKKKKRKKEKWYMACFKVDIHDYVMA